jgi:hypothetical protein
LWHDSKYSTAANETGQQKMQRLLETGRWRTREVMDEAVYENRLPLEGIIR